MPYQVGSENLPENVKKMPKEEQEKWVKAFNSAFENYSKDDPKTAESKAFATANAVIKKNKEAHDHSEA
ncbi:MAG: ChaB family protein, partial [Mesotoga sp.]|uniref:ChaB family protein n=1 Tax=Mesotoga sp. TaxID=2053577 RepID=UPI0035662CA8